MHHHITAKQPNSKMCLVCGLQNQFGLRSFFYELDNNELLAVFKPMTEHQGYPGRLHGGIATAILDESIGRSIMIGATKQVWGVTIEFNIKFRQPIPLDEEIRAVCWVTKDGGWRFTGSGEILLSDGQVAVEGKGKYLKMPIEKIADFDKDEQQWQVVKHAKDPTVVEL